MNVTRNYHLLPTLVGEAAGKPSPATRAAQNSNFSLPLGGAPRHAFDSTQNILKIGSQIPSWILLPDRILEGHIAPEKVCPTLEVKS